jgi:hypothetical protein
MPDSGGKVQYALLKAGGDNSTVRGGIQNRTFRKQKNMARRERRRDMETRRTARFGM